MLLRTDAITAVLVGTGGPMPSNRAQSCSEVMPPEWSEARSMAFQYSREGQATPVYAADGVVVSAFAAQHPPIEPNVGYRVEVAGKTVVLSGDTVFTDALVAQSRGADLLISDVMAMDAVRQIQAANEAVGNEAAARIMHDIRDYYISAEALGALAEQAGVKRLALTHLAPTIDQRLLVRSFFRRPIAARYSGELVVGPDGTRVVIPL